MKVPVLFGWIMIFVVVVSYKRRKADRTRENKERDFWERENAANATRKQDISNLNYVDFTGVSLPFARFSDDFLHQCEEQILKLKDEKILNLTGITNTDLKLKYGAANLTFLTQCDQNFTLLARTLNSWGQRLKELSHTEEAIQVLTFAVSIESDIKNTYQLLAELFLQTGQQEKLKDLKSSASNLNSLMKEPILAMLDKMENSD
ncbi:MAG: hypothetical protein HFH50_06535 [Lachnospiraceae bacterium]|jgi:hypothetical protein|nr:hypothetical protein [Lachnospiraceae bacterium]MCI8873609.1 hypothetical protein [Lachnospiraceae bacterium]MCI9059155.1 hypothetical protein [Lachnospiraceae bacterium]GFI33243.1 hypothetical protein IMSAGC013_04651 [Lachnospiraceae bacterium]